MNSFNCSLVSTFILKVTKIQTVNNCDANIANSLVATE